MIRRLRWKITGVTLLVSALVLTAVFACVYLFSRNNIAQSYEYQLRQAVVSGTSEARVPCFVAEVLPSGTVRVSGSNYYDLQDEDTLLPLVTAALSADADSGVLPAQHMRYFRLEGALTVRIAFMDSTFEQATLRSLVRVCLLIGAAALLVLFGLSWLLSGFVTRPVARTWQNQQQFLSDASHELKTPLTVILSSADLLKTSAQPEQRQYVDNISVESRRMKALVEDMLTLSRTESGRAAPFAPLDLSDLVTDAALRFEPVAFEAGHPLQYDIPVRRPPAAGPAAGYPAGQRREVRRQGCAHPPDAGYLRQKRGAGSGESRRPHSTGQAAPHLRPVLPGGRCPHRRGRLRPWPCHRPTDRPAAQGRHHRRQRPACHPLYGDAAPAALSS